MEQVRDYNLEKELEIYKAMFEALPQSMFLLDKDKNIIGIFNAAAETLAGLSVDDIVGRNVLDYVDDPSSPFYEACTMLNRTFDLVFNTGVPLKFEYAILDASFEAMITKISGDRVLSQVRDISDIVSKQTEAENKKHKELSMALTAGGLTSWYYDVREKIISSKQENNVIDGELPLEKLMSLIDPDYRQATADMFADLIEHGKQHGHITVRVLNRAGKWQWSDVHAIPHEYGPNGEVTLIVGSQKDVTLDHEYNEKLKQLVKQNELILNNSNSGFAYLTPDLKVEWENISKVFCDPELVGLFRGDIQFENQYIRKDVSQVLKEQGRSVGKFKTAGGLIVEFLVQSISGESGRLEGIVLRLEDVTEREESICELAMAKEKAEQSDKLKSAFLANMSHEIRTPLNSIVGFSRLIPSAESPEERQEYIDVIDSNSEMLLNLINDILDLSKIEAGYFTLNDTVFDLAGLFTEQEMTFRRKMRNGVELVCKVPPGDYFVKLDRVRVMQLVSNFMTNAIKFTKQGYIKMGFETVPDGVRIYVEDTGCGMDEDQVERVFNRFEKFNSFEQGTGLGTSIAKAIVDGYKGKIGVQSVLGQGSIFWAILPVDACQNNEAKSNCEHTN